MPEVRQALWNRGYNLVIIGGNMTGFVKLLVNSNKDVKMDVKSAFKSVWVTNATDGSEDYLISDKIFGLNSESMTNFRNEIIAKPPPKSVKELITSMIPPEGIKKGKNIAGTELLDGEEMRNDASEEDNGNEVDPEKLLAALSGNIPIETTPKKQ